MARSAKARISLRNRTISMNSGQSTDNRFNENDRAILNEINDSVKDLRKEINLLKQELNQTKTEIKPK